MLDFKKELERYGLTEETYEQCLKDSSEKVQNLNDMDWQEIIEKYDLPMTKRVLKEKYVFTKARAIEGLLLKYLFIQNKVFRKIRNM